MSVVIPTYNRPDRCVRLLRALSHQTLPARDFEVIAVDDCSTDNTTDALGRLKDTLPYDFRLLRTPSNRGPGPARNLGWRSASASIIAFTDDDCVPEPRWLEAAIAAFDTDPRTGLAQGRTVARNPEDLEATRYTYGVMIEGPSPHFETCNIFYRREALQDAGGFGEPRWWWSAGAGFEDTTAGWATLQAGWKSDFVTDAVIAHDVEHRPIGWWIKTSLSQYREVAAAHRFPEYRAQTFWRPWAPRRYDAAFVVAVLGAAAAIRWRPAVMATLPYVWWRRPSIRKGQFLRACAETVMIDSARTVGHLYGSVLNRTLVL